MSAPIRHGNGCSCKCKPLPPFHHIRKGEIFVFGSNQAGNHGKGAAKTARLRYGAIHGIAEGFRGRSYAIPTKDWDIRPLALSQIEEGVKKFLVYAAGLGMLKRFFVTRIGCGLAGYKDHQIAPMFKIPVELPNLRMPPEWEGFLK